MSRETIAPTKSNLLKTKERLSIAEEGYDLLEQKREILVGELMRKVNEVKLLERDLDAAVEEAYPALKRMLITVGRERAGKLSESIRYRFDIREKRFLVAGMNLPGLEVKLPAFELKYALNESSAEVDETAVEFFALLTLLTRLASVRTIAWRLAREVRKTQRRCNALEKMVIPQARDTKTYIESSLEEKDRDAFFSSKLLKRRMEAPKLRTAGDKDVAREGEARRMEAAAEQKGGGVR
jgi:V/A-type H+-transporting ATPase subunit D